MQPLLRGEMFWEHVAFVEGGNVLEMCAFVEGEDVLGM